MILRSDGLYIFTMLAMFLPIPIVVHGHLLIQNKDVELYYKITFNNHCQRDTHRIQTYHRVTISDCVTECGLRSHCKAMNYHIQMGLCELFTEVETVFISGGCVYVQRIDVQVIKSPCADGCNMGQACDIKTRTCIIKECTSFPKLENGIVFGNRKEVGMKILTKCDQNFKHKHGVKQSTCEMDGTWKPHVECSRDCGTITTPPNAIIVTDSGTLEGSEIQYACKPDFWPTDGSLTRVCLSDGIWNGTELLCNDKICIGNGQCYVKYPNKDLPGHDLQRSMTYSFDECSAFCETIVYESIEYCNTPLPGASNNCFCKSATFEHGYPLRDLANCHYHQKL